MMPIVSESSRLLIPACAKSHLGVASGKVGLGHSYETAVAARHSNAALAAERSKEKLQNDY